MKALIYKLLDRRTRLGARLILAITPSVALVLLFGALLFPGIGLKILAILFAAVGMYFLPRGLLGLIFETHFRIRLCLCRRRKRIR